METTKITDNNIFDAYNELLDEYIGFLYTDYANIKNNNMMRYHEEEYLKLIEKCKSIKSHNTKLKVPFKSGYNLYISMNKFFKAYKKGICNEELNTDLINLNLSLISLESDIIKSITE